MLLVPSPATGLLLVGAPSRATAGEPVAAAGLVDPSLGLPVKAACTVCGDGFVVEAASTGLAGAHGCCCFGSGLGAAAAGGVADGEPIKAASNAAAAATAAAALAAVDCDEASLLLDRLGA